MMCSTMISSNLYFLNAPLNYKLTGIEHASLRRFFLFKKSGLSPTIVTLNFSSDLSRIIMFHKITEEHFLNFYRYYQNFNEDHKYDLDDLKCKLINAVFSHVEGVPYDYRVSCSAQYTMYVRCFEKTARISYINYFDQNRRKIRREIYDFTGYKSKEIILFNGKTIQENYFNHKGEIYLTVNSDNDLKHYCLKDRDSIYFFNSELELYRYWLKSIINGPTVFFIDKNRIYNPIVGPIKHRNLKKVSIVHSTHTSNPNEINNNRINYNYKYLLENTEQFDACVVSSSVQHEELLSRFDVSFSTHVIPPSYINNYRVNLDDTINDHFRILSIGRISVEKRHIDMILAMKIVRAFIPQAQLEFFGMGNVDLKKQLEEKIKQEGLEDCIFFKNYSYDIQSELFNSDLTLVTSTVESFCISILDSLEQGTPVIAYDIKYGPSSIIEDGVNGTLVENGNIDKLAQAIIDFYFKHKLNYTKNTKYVMKNYSFNHVSNLWINFLNKLNSEIL